MTVVWSTAYMDEAERCAHVLMLDEGRLLQAGPPTVFLDRVRGRTFLARPPEDGGVMSADWTRRTWQIWSSDERSEDVLVQGSSVRVLLRSDVSVAGELRATAPRLEDA